MKKKKSLAETHPELAKQWHPTKNGDLTPEAVTAGSGKKVWWFLPYDVPEDYPTEQHRGKHFNFEWETRINHRVNGTECPYFSGQAVMKGFNDLATTHPDLAKEWHPTKNGNLSPEMVTSRSGKKVFWFLSYNDPGTGRHFDFEWEETVSNRTESRTKIGCPFLSGRRVYHGFNDLASTHPELAKQWHPTKNGKLTPDKVSFGSQKKVMWYLPYDVPDDYPVKHLRGKHFDFEWSAEIKSRVNGMSVCPYLSGHAVWPGFNDLVTTHPELAKEWHPTKNGKLTPDRVSFGITKKVWWYLPYDVPDDYPVKHLRGKHFDFEWSASIGHRAGHNSGCPYLSGRAVWPGFNDLATTHPELAKEWHPTKNGKLTPDRVSFGIAKKVWWYLPYDVPDDYPVKHLRGKHYDFEWSGTICNRTACNYNCPYLSGQAIWFGFNDLATTHPELAKEWHPTKNGSLMPEDVTAGSKKKVWWFLPYDDPCTGRHFDFEWKASIFSRARGVNCPYLSESHGEKHTRKYLSSYNYEYAYEKNFHDLKGVGGGYLTYDFHITGTKVLIEYQGLQHYKPVDVFGGKEQFKIQQEHDRRKREYAKKNGYKLIEISYKYDTYEKVAAYLDEHLLPLLKKSLPASA